MIDLSSASGVKRKKDETPIPLDLKTSKPEDK
jgi:hypothetical protein